MAAWGRHLLLQFRIKPRQMCREFSRAVQSYLFNEKVWFVSSSSKETSKIICILDFYDADFLLKIWRTFTKIFRIPYPNLNILFSCLIKTCGFESYDCNNKLYHIHDRILTISLKLFWYQFKLHEKGGTLSYKKSALKNCFI